MATMKCKDQNEANEIAGEALWLAWQAVGGPSGMGFMQDKRDATKADVVARTLNRGDYSGVPSSDCGINADYVFGRMMKLRFTVRGDTIEYPDHEPRGDYQAWCYEYKSFRELFDAAAAKVREAAKAAA